MSTALRILSFIHPSGTKETENEMSVGAKQTARVHQESKAGQTDRYSDRYQKTSISRDLYMRPQFSRETEEEERERKGGLLQNSIPEA